MPNNNDQCPENHYQYIIEPGDTLYAISKTYNVSISSIIRANTGINPDYLIIGQRICIPSPGINVYPNCQEIINAMQVDINMLKNESSGQQIEEKNYKNSKKKTTKITKLTDKVIQFNAVPVTFSGNYRGLYTLGKSYPYYPSAASGGQRGITVKDNFGVWHTFGYHIPLP